MAYGKKPMINDSMLTNLIINWNGNYSSKGHLRKRLPDISTLNRYPFDIITMLPFDLTPDDKFIL